MKKTKFLSLLMCAVVIFASCEKEQDCTLPDEPQIEVGEGLISLSLHDATSVFGTRAVSQGPDEEGSTDERFIGELEFYVFNSDGTLDPKAAYLPYTFVNGEKYTFSVSAGYKTVLVAANMGLGALSGNLTQIRATLLEAEINNPLAIPSTGIPMAGEVENVYVGAGTVQTVGISVSRLFAKFNAPDGSNAVVDLTSEKEDELVELWKNNGGDDQIHGEIAFDLKGYIVVNGLKKSYSFPNYGGPESGVWNTSVWTLASDDNNYTASNYDTDGKLVEVYSGTSFLTNQSVYLYENSPRRTSTPLGYAANTVYSLIIEADLFDTGKAENSVTRYWRINVNNDDVKELSYKVLRNAIYNMKINNVKTLGSSNPGEEEEKPIIPDGDEGALDVKISIASWRVFNEGSDI